jgi:hypothetical protein
VHLGFEHQALRVHEQVPFPAPNPLVAIVSPLLATNPSGIGRLGVGDARARQRVPARAGRKGSRSEALSRSKVLSIFHFLNQL